MAQRVGVDSLLTAGDTAAAIGALRKDLSGPEAQCLLATLITSQTTSRHEDWRDRLEAEQLFDRSLKERLDPGCFLAYSALMEKQGIRIDAGRLAKRAFGLLRDHPESATPALLAETYYRRALPIAEWVRNFDHLVSPQDLPVSTPSCVDASGYFCESLEHPFLFFERLRRGAPLDGLVRDERATLGALLDSALAHDPAHPEALRLALREAAIGARWIRFRELTLAARQAAPRAVSPLLALLAAEVMQERYDRATVVFDTVRAWLGTEATARYEGLALITQPTVGDSTAATYSEAIWALSDPLYLTATNERRVAHYARVYLADVLFSDPAQAVAGRQTDQGRLLIRYGFPPYWYVVRADKALELTPAQREFSGELLACATIPELKGVPPDCSAVAGVASKGQRMDGGGRWSFWFYDSTAAPFIFEQALGVRIAHHKMMTESRTIDQTLAREAPATYDTPFAPADLHALFTRFPRPDGPVIELHARFVWDSTAVTLDSLELGYFVHDRMTGQLVRRGRAGQTTREAPAGFNATIGVPWGKLRLAVEGLAVGARAASQVRSTLDLLSADSGQLTVSDLLLGDSARAPDVIADRRAVAFAARADSVYERRAPLALYWETYGLRTDTTGSDSLRARDGRHVHYHVRLHVQDAGGRRVAATLLRSVGGAFGLSRTDDQAVEWDVQRMLSSTVAPDLLLLTAPDDEGQYRIAIEITDAVDGRVAHTERAIWLKARAERSSEQGR